MTLDEMARLDREILTCQDVAPILGANPATLHTQAVSRPELLGFPVVVAGNRVKIPRTAFIRFMRGDIPPAYQPMG